VHEKVVPQCCGTTQPKQKEILLSFPFDRFRNHFIALSAATLLGFLASQSATAQTGSTIVRVDPATFEVGQGQVEQVNIVIENAQDVYGIEVRAKFDPSIFEIADADPAADGVQMIPGTFIKPDFLVRNTADNQKGSLQYVITQVNPTPPVNGNGVVVSILVRGKTLGKRGQLTIDFVDIADRRGRKLPVQAKSGAISVVSPKPPTPTPTSNATATTAPTQSLEALPTEVAVEAQTTSKPASRTLNGDLFLDSILVLIALGGCLAAIAVIGIAGIVIVKRPARNPRPNNPLSEYSTDGTRWL